MELEDQNCNIPNTSDMRMTDILENRQDKPEYKKSILDKPDMAITTDSTSGQPGPYDLFLWSQNWREDKPSEIEHRNKLIDGELNKWNFSIRELPHKNKTSYIPDKYELEYAMELTNPIHCKDQHLCTSNKAFHAECTMIHNDMEAWNATKGKHRHFNKTNTFIVYCYENQTVYKDFLDVHKPFGPQPPLPSSNNSVWIHQNVSWDDLTKKMPQNRIVIEQTMPFTYRHILKSVSMTTPITLEILNIQAQTQDEIKPINGIAITIIDHEKLNQYRNLKANNVTEQSLNQVGDNHCQIDDSLEELEKHCKLVESSRPRINMMRSTATMNQTPQQQQPVVDMLDDPNLDPNVDHTGNDVNAIKCLTEQGQSPNIWQTPVTQGIDHQPQSPNYTSHPLKEMPHHEDLRRKCETNGPINMGLMASKLRRYTYSYETRKKLHIQLLIIDQVHGIQSQEYKQCEQDLKSKEEELENLLEEILVLHVKSKTSEEDEYLEMPKYGLKTSYTMEDIEALPKFNPEENKISLFDFWHKISSYIQAEALTEDTAKTILAHLLSGKAFTVYMFNNDQTIRYIMTKLRDRWPASFPTKAKFEEGIDTFERANNETIQSSMDRFRYMINCLYKNESGVISIIENKCKLKAMEIAHPIAREQLERKRKLMHDQGMDLTYEDIMTILSREEDILSKRKHTPQPQINTMKRRENDMAYKILHHDKKTPRHQKHEPRMSKHDYKYTDQRKQYPLKHHPLDSKHRYSNPYPEHSGSQRMYPSRDFHEQEYGHDDFDIYPSYGTRDYYYYDEIQNPPALRSSHYESDEKRCKDFKAARTIHPKKLAQMNIMSQ